MSLQTLSLNIALTINVNKDGTYSVEVTPTTAEMVVPPQDPALAQRYASEEADYGFGPEKVSEGHIFEEVADFEIDGFCPATPENVSKLGPQGRALWDNLKVKPNQIPDWVYAPTPPNIPNQGWYK